MDISVGVDIVGIGCEPVYDADLRRQFFIIIFFRVFRKN